MTRKVRLLQVIDRLGDAGAEQLLYTFAAGHDRSRFDVHICSLRPPATVASGEAMAALGLPILQLDQQHAYDLDVLLTLTNYIRRERIDIIHTHLLAADVMGRMAGLLTRRPVLSTIHNAGIDLDKEASHRQLMERLTARLWCRRLIVVSPMLGDEIAAWFGVPRQRVVAIPNGVDTARFTPPPGFDRAAKRRELLGGDYRLITNVARLTEQKGQRYLVEAAAAVLATRPDVRLALVGGYGDLGEELLRMAAERGIGDRIILTGVRPDVPEILAASDVFVLSSIWEGMPLSLLEAMAAGVPAIATDVGGVPDVLRDGQNGLLVPPANASALAAALAELLDHPDHARQLAATAHEMAVRDYDVSTMIRRTEDLYRRELKLD